MAPDTVAATATTPSEEWATGGRGGRQRLIAHPDTGEMIPVQRVSSFAKTLDDKEGLIPWKAWCAVKGADVLPSLAAQVRHSPRAPKGLIDQLAEAGGSKDAAQRGSDRHAILAMALTGASLPPMPGDARAELDAIIRIVDSLGRIVALEAPTASVEYGTAGTVDLVLEAPDGRTVVADFKTGKEVRRLEHGIQLITHARSWYYDVPDNRWLGEVAPTRPRLVVIHAPQDGAVPQAVDIDVDSARSWADLAVRVREARRESAKAVRAA